MPLKTPQAIWPPHEAFYIHSMRFNAQSAVQSIEQLNAIFHVVKENNPKNAVSALPVFRLLGELQNLVIQAAALSRYFWPVRSAHAWRGEHLRRCFGVNESSALRSRDLRNAIEHFDEQLDNFLAQGPVGHFLPEYVGPFEEPEGVPVHLFRAYYIDTGVFELLGKRFEVQSIAAEVAKIHSDLKRMGATGGRLSH